MDRFVLLSFSFSKKKKERKKNDSKERTRVGIDSSYGTLLAAGIRTPTVWKTVYSILEELDIRDWTVAIYYTCGLTHTIICLPSFCLASVFYCWAPAFIFAFSLSFRRTKNKKEKKDERHNRGDLPTVAIVRVCSSGCHFQELSLSLILFCFRLLRGQNKLFFPVLSLIDLRVLEIKRFIC